MKAGWEVKLQSGTFAGLYRKARKNLKPGIVLDPFARDTRHVTVEGERVSGYRVKVRCGIWRLEKWVERPI